MDTEDSPTVLLVEDEELALNTYRLWLEDDYDIRTATDGTEALEQVSENVDVVLLDRRMPNTTGDEALDVMQEQGYDCKVAMVTAVDPDVDIVDMPFDGYLTKPIDREDLVGIINRLTEVARHDGISQELFAVVEKQSALEEKLDQAALEECSEYSRITERVEELSDQADAAVGTMDRETFETALRDVGNGRPDE